MEPTCLPDYDQERLLTFPHLLWEGAGRSPSPPVEGHTSAREGDLTASVGTSHTGRGTENKLLAVKLKPYWYMLLRADSNRG